VTRKRGGKKKKGSLLACLPEVELPRRATVAQKAPRLRGKQRMRSGFTSPGGNMLARPSRIDSLLSSRQQGSSRSRASGSRSSFYNSAPPCESSSQPFNLVESNNSQLSQSQSQDLLALIPSLSGGSAGNPESGGGGGAAGGSGGSSNRGRAGNGNGGGSSSRRSRFTVNSPQSPPPFSLLPPSVPVTSAASSTLALASVPRLSAVAASAGDKRPGGTGSGGRSSSSGGDAGSETFEALYMSRHAGQVLDAVDGFGEELRATRRAVEAVETRLERQLDGVRTALGTAAAGAESRLD
ncbi:unnamed protein product, partial [Phaeothamnion confervicola]